MGEAARQVWNVGSPAVDGLDLVLPNACMAARPAVVVMQHPIGAPARQERQWMQQTRAAVEASGCQALVLAPNHDPGHEGIRAALKGVPVAEHLPRPRFLAILAGAAAIVGNSSAGLIEAAALRVPCVNIGPRQAGRQKPGNVIDCGYGEANVSAALAKALQLELRRVRHPYGDGHAGERIARLLAEIDLEAVPVRKRNTY